MDASLVLHGSTAGHPVVLWDAHLPRIRSCGLDVPNIQIELPRRFASSRVIAVAFEFFSNRRSKILG